MNKTTSKVYVLTDAKNRITRCEGGYTTPLNLDGWIKIDEGVGDRYNLCQSNYFDGPLYTNDGFPRYKLENGKVVERTQEEIALDLLPNLKLQTIQKSKEDLQNYLANHPITWTDGQQYSITLEKQSQLTATIVAAQADGEPPEWNTTGGQCKEWDIKELASLGVAIKNRVKKLVKYQQAKEIEINSVSTMEELNAISIDYDSV